FMKLKSLIYILLSITFSLPSFAVSDKDMEQAKVIAAKYYLRWANNGSGYLDDLNPSSMAELESKLKTQEKENLKAFNKVNIPSDYASWDKQRFVQFWGTTFFTSPALSADGKRGKDRVKAKVSAMNVSSPTESKKEESKVEEPEKEEPATENKEETPSNAATGDEDAIVIPEPQEVVHQEEAIVDSTGMIQAEEESMALSNREEKVKSHTWIYVVILIVLVILVVWLMVYAANMMKKQGAESKSITGGVSDKKIKKEIEALEAENERLRSDLSRQKRELDETKSELARLRAGASEIRKQVKTEAPRAAAAVAPVAAAPKKERPEERTQPKVISEIFLGRANPKGLFVRGDRRPNPEHTIYRLDTKDGIVGTFRFADTPEAFAVAISNPLHFLAGGCVSENFEEAEGAARIITEAPGTAILENGCWKVLRKSKIRFE
ncbi:MAG: hypothetical protein K2H18_02080, partial [Muribaculaceae bacterium]|nr:hypothetical protein [Muribaculaceae bacterium]